MLATFRVNGDILLPSTSPHPGSNDRGKAPLLSKLDIHPTPIPRPIPIGRTPTASDCDRDRETLAPAFGGELCRGRGKWLVGDVETEEVGEKVGKGEVDCDRDGCSSIWLERVRVRVFYHKRRPISELTLVSLISPAEKLFARVVVPGAAENLLGVLLPPITPNIPAGEPRPESGCDPPREAGAGSLSPAG